MVTSSKPRKKAPPRKKVARVEQAEVVDIAEARREKERLRLRAHRAATGNEYDKKYKKAQDIALRNLKTQYPNAYKRLLAEARTEVGLPPSRR